MPRPRSGGVAKRRYAMSKVRSGTERRYAMSKVRSSGREEIPHIQSKEQDGALLEEP